MRHLFIDPSRLLSDPVTVDGPDHHHLVHVLRVREGDPLVVLDGSGSAWHAWVTAVDKRSVSVRLAGPADAAPEPCVRLTVAQAIGKGDRFEEAIEHATEAGACAFIPLVTERTVVRLSAADRLGKLERWRAIAKSAAEQSGRSRIPEVLPAATLPETLCRAPEFDLSLLLHPEGVPLGGALKEWSPGGARSVVPSGNGGARSVVPGRPHRPPGADGAVPSRRPGADGAAPSRLGGGASAAGVGTSCVLLLVGPEGGFAPGEIERAHEAGVSVVSLGPHVLRTETAAVVAVSQLLFAAAWLR